MRLVSLVALCLLLVSCGGKGVPAVVPAATETPILIDPQNLVLKLDDMPTGFTVDPTATGANSNDKVAAGRPNPQEAAKQLNERGRVDGYESAFKQSGLAALTGLAAVYDYAAVFKDFQGAHASFADAIDESAAKGTAIAMPPVGDESKAFTMTQASGQGDSKLQIATYVVVFRKGNVLAGVATSAIVAATQAEDTLRFARLIESRIKP